MKIVWLTFVLVIASAVSVFAQRFAFYDNEYVLKHLPDYISAQKEIDALSKQWQTEADNRNLEIEKLTKAYQADQVLLTDEMRRRRQAEIADKEKSVREFYNSKFGYQKELYQQNIKLTKPIFEKVQKAVQAVAENLQLDGLFDKNVMGMSYIGPRLDKSNDVIIRMGYKPGNLVEK